MDANGGSSALRTSAEFFDKARNLCSFIRAGQGWREALLLAFRSDFAGPVAAQAGSTRASEACRMYRQLCIL
ncbi:hypothetical protein BMJ26_15940 [Sinorhizobium medicae]|nr:hypothetical protein BMJ31_00150 [Sinorhizobium medicae]PLU38511.1 hypothetical protein BMJ26_15940 [Sinorhizobium medicae]PLU44160.1 hypothetical protein BMJ28_04975 [Sinorhizobium medicae]PLU46558.1 hypothetical protein BMJ25_19905 [Sinorhizobium medicae]PLU62586.1 hypothetical protein BMJ24_04840 [Sinorhizobium medicae]